MAALNFDARNVAPQQSFEPIPAGVYLVHITDSDVVPTKTGGEMLKLTHEVLDGTHKGRKVFSNINTRNANPEAERIGQSQLSALCHAVNVLVPRESSMLHMIPVRMRVIIRPAGLDKMGVHREAQNEVKGYEAAGPGPGAAPAQAVQRPAGSPTPPAPAAAAQTAHQAPPAAAPAAAPRPAYQGSSGGIQNPWARRAAGATA